MNARTIDGDIIGTAAATTSAPMTACGRGASSPSCIDYLIVGLLLIPFAILVFLLGLLTFGLGWSLFAVLAPVVALLYVWNTLGGRNQATTGMRMMGIRLERLDGRPIDGMLAVVHSVLFWAGNVDPDAADPAGDAVHRPQAHAARPAARHRRHPQRPLRSARQPQRDLQR